MRSDPTGGALRHRAGRLLAAAGLAAAFLGGVGSPDMPWAPAPARAVTVIRTGEAPAAVRDLSHITGPRIETTVVALELRGLGKLDVIGVPDLDMVERPDGVRLLPLLRLLRGLDIVPTDSASTLTFLPDGAPIVTVDYAAGTATIDGASAEVPMVAGISDITNLPELYVGESAVAAMLALDVAWDPRLYAYTLRANRTLRLFDRRRENAWLARRSAFASYDLPGRLPPARAQRSILPTLQFTEFQLLSSLGAQKQDPGVQGTLGTPRVGVWADVLGGNLAARLSGRSSGGATRVEQLSWSTSFDQAALSVGSVNVGLSELVFPSMSLIGAVANGRMGGRGGSEDPSQLGREQAFLPLRVFDGYARLGSEVTLNINGQDVETRRVEPAPNSPPGDGPYRFEGVNLFSSRLNDVRIRVVTPEGIVEETRRRVLGTDLLMEAGEVAFIGGFGGRRNPSLDDFAADGRFGGGRLNLGLSRRLSTGMSAAYQDRLYGPGSFFFQSGGTPLRAPSRSLHLGSRLAWQPLDPLLLSAEAAQSRALPDSGTNMAVRADAEYHLGQLLVHPAAFRYGPTFFDGQNPDQRDLAGTSLGLLWRYGSGNQVAVGGSRTRDDLAGTRGEPLRSSEVQASWSVRGIIPRTVLTLGGRQIWITDSGTLQTGLLGLEGTLPWGWSLRGHQEFGDDIRLRLGERLDAGSTWRFDLSNRMSSAPGGGDGIGIGSLTSALELRRRIDDDWNVSVAHRTLGAVRRSSVDLYRTPAVGGIWQARLSPGYEWDSRSPFLQDRFELFLSRSRSNRLVFEHQLLHREWLVRLSFQIQTEVGFAGVRPVPLFDSRLDPGSGGVKGRVFLDTNGNGLPDDGEPGLPGVEVMTDQGRRAVSTSGGLFVISNSSSLRRTRVSLQPDALPATYTLTQATQEALLRPGEFTEVNLGVAILGSVSGAVLARVVMSTPPGANAETGVSGVRVLLVDEVAGNEAGNSITGHDGVFTIADIRPGRYVVRPDPATLPGDFVLESSEIPVEVTSETEPVEKKGLVFMGRYTDPRTLAERVQDGNGVVYKVFSGPRDGAVVAARPKPAPAKSAPVQPEPTTAGLMSSNSQPPAAEPAATQPPAAQAEPTAKAEPMAEENAAATAVSATEEKVPPRAVPAEPPTAAPLAEELASVKEEHARAAVPPPSNDVAVAPTPAREEHVRAAVLPPSNDTAVAPTPAKEEHARAAVLPPSNDVAVAPTPEVAVAPQEPASTRSTPDGWRPLPGTTVTTPSASPFLTLPLEPVVPEPSVGSAEPLPIPAPEPATIRPIAAAPDSIPAITSERLPEETATAMGATTPPRSFIEPLDENVTGPAKDERAVGASPEPVMAQSETTPERAVTHAETMPVPAVTRTETTPEPVVTRTDPAATRIEPAVTRSETTPEPVVTRTETMPEPTVTRTETTPEPEVTRATTREPVVRKASTPEPETALAPAVAPDPKPEAAPAPAVTREREPVPAAPSLPATTDEATEEWVQGVSRSEVSAESASPVYEVRSRSVASTAVPRGTGRRVSTPAASMNAGRPSGAAEPRVRPVRPAETMAFVPDETALPSSGSETLPILDSSPPATTETNTPEEATEIPSSNDEPEVADRDSRLRLAYGRRLPAPPPLPDGVPCECEVEGTVEVRSDRPLNRPVVVSISVADAPASRDSVELFMGSPREFRLGRVPCGSHELTIQASSKRFTIAAAAPTRFECVADRLRQFRIVLEAR